MGMADGRFTENAKNEIIIWKNSHINNLSQTMKKKLLIFFTIFFLNITINSQQLIDAVKSDDIGTITIEASELKSSYGKPDPKKDEFEKTQDYQIRLEKFRKENQPKQSEKTYQIILNYQIAEYNADQEKMSIKTVFSNPSYLQFSALANTSSNTSSYEAVNNFGVKVKVNKYIVHSYYLIFNSTESSTPLMNIELDLPPDKAKELKPNIRTLVEFELEYPFIENTVTNRTPTLNSPIEEIRTTYKLFTKLHKISFFDQKTGDIIFTKEID